MSAERHRRPPARKVTRGLALAAVVAALAIGIAVGYVARGGPGPARLVTVDRSLPVATVTVTTPSPSGPNTP